MTGGVETIEGDIRVAARLSMGLEYLRLFFTDQRIIVAHIGKRGAGSQATVSFFGRLSAAFEELFKGGRESAGMRKLGASTPQQILAEDKDNFFLNYSDIVEVVVDEAFARPKLIVLTKDEKFQFTLTGVAGGLKELLFRVLDGKMRVV